MAPGLALVINSREMIDCLCVVFNQLRPRDMIPFREVCREWYDISNTKVVVDHIVDNQYTMNRLRNQGHLFDNFRSVAPYLYSHANIPLLPFEYMLGRYESKRLTVGDTKWYLRQSNCLDVAILHALDTSTELPRTKYHTRTSIKSLYDRSYVWDWQISSELLHELVRHNNIGVLSRILLPSTRDKVNSNEALEYVVRLVYQYESVPVYHWLKNNTKCNVAKNKRPGSLRTDI